jgi:hypothetical protein
MDHTSEVCPRDLSFAVTEEETASSTSPIKLSSFRAVSVYDNLPLTNHQLQSQIQTSTQAA